MKFQCYKHVKIIVLIRFSLTILHTHMYGILYSEDMGAIYRVRKRYTCDTSNYCVLLMFIAMNFIQQQLQFKFQLPTFVLAINYYLHTTFIYVTS